MSKKSPPSNVVELVKKPAAAGRTTPVKPAPTPVMEAPEEVKAVVGAVKPAARKAAAPAKSDTADEPKAAKAVKADAGKAAKAAKVATPEVVPPAVQPAAKPAKSASPARTAKAAESTATVPSKPTGRRVGVAANDVPAGKVAAAAPAAKSASGKAAAAAKPAARPSRKTPPPATEIPASVTPPRAGSKLEKSLGSKPAGSLKSPIRVFQIYFEAWQKELLDPAFAAINNAGVKSETLEFDVFERLAKSEHVKGATLWGALSWRFAEKTGMSGADLVKAVEAVPGMDVYYCNPHPQNEALFHNMWTQGETTHPRFLALSRALFQAVGLPEDELGSIATSSSYSAANYFIGSPAFWEKYLSFVRKVLALADKKMSPEARRLLHSAMADDRGLHRGATYVPFIVERLFPLFLKTEGRGLKAQKITLPEREREMNVHLKLLREMKDVAHKTKSPWLAACWVNYRNLYLSQVNGKAWCQKYLRAITPTDIKFG